MEPIQPINPTPLPVSGAVGVLTRHKVFWLVVLAVASFHLAYLKPALSFLMVGYLFGLQELTYLKSSKTSSYLGLLLGLLVFGPQMDCLWTIFGPAAIGLWLVLAFWIRLFLVLACSVRARFDRFLAAVIIPCLWTGLEYFRSELYYLRFTWLNAGYAFSGASPWIPTKSLGVYGIGFCLMAMIGLVSLLHKKARWGTLLGITGILAVLVNLPMPALNTNPEHDFGRVQVAGIQLEFPSEREVVPRLNQLIKAHPEAQLLVLSEYTFNTLIPKEVRDWCRTNHRYLIAGGHDPVSEREYFNTAFVVGPDGEIVFRQAKSVPIQFFKDGLPATEQKIWNSPWGKIGLCICYDLSYTRVTDQLIRLGAQAIIVPTMDVIDWGRHQHELHARIAPTRAAEYGVPIFRLASSGISQQVNAHGRVLRSAPFGAEGGILAGTMVLAGPGSLPLDRLISPIATGVVLATMLSLLVLMLQKKGKIPSGQVT